MRNHLAGEGEVLASLSFSVIFNVNERKDRRTEEQKGRHLKQGLK
jgi:hypothetical protein